MNNENKSKRKERQPERFMHFSPWAYVLDALCESEEQRGVPEAERKWKWTPACLKRVVDHPRPTDLIVEQEK